VRRQVPRLLSGIDHLMERATRIPVLTKEHDCKPINALLIALLAIFLGAPQAHAQSAYGYSSIDIGSTYVTSYSVTDADYEVETYYSMETDAYLYAGGSLAASDWSSDSVSLSTPTSVNTSYYVQTNHWIDAVTPSPYCFSCVAEGDWYEGSLAVTGSTLDEWEYGADGDVYLGTTWASGDTDGSPPDITGMDYTTYGNEVRGTSGYVILYGSNFTTPYGSTSVSSSFGSPAYVSATQINLYYSIPLNTDSGTYSSDIGVSTPYGSDTADFYVYDPTPTITSMSSSEWNAGSVYTGFSISGSGFGSSPSVSFSDSYVSFSPTSAGDTSITGTLTIGSSDPGGSVTVTVNADGYGGSSFVPQSGGGSGTVGTSGTVYPIPHITNVSGGPFIAGNTYSSVSISGTNFVGLGGSVQVSGGGSFSVSSWGSSSINGTLTIPQSVTDTNLQFAVWPYYAQQSPYYSVTLGCGDIRNTMIYEYWANTAITFHPACSDFTQTSPSTDFSFGTLNSSRESPYTSTSTQYPWAILRGALGTGLDTVYGYSPITMTINSGYRNPGRQAVLSPSYPNDSHTQGLGVDIATSNSTDWGSLVDKVKSMRGATGPPCVEPYSVQNTYNHVHLDWRTACPVGW